VLEVRYQTNTADLYSNYYRFGSDIVIQISRGEVSRSLDRWENGHDEIAFSEILPDQLKAAVAEYVKE